MLKKIVVLVLIVLCASLAYTAYFGWRTTDARRVEEFVRNEVKLKSSSKQVTGFLQAQHIDHGDLEHLPETDSRYARYGKYPVISAIVRNSARGLLWTESIQIMFVFDEERELIKIDVYPVTMRA